MTGEDETTDSVSVPVTGEGAPIESENNSSEIAGTLPDNDNSLSCDYSYDEKSITDSGDENNPATGIAVSLIPLTAALAVMTAAIKRKRK